MYIYIYVLNVCIYIYIYIHIYTSIAGMSPQSHCGDEEDGRIGLSS